MQSFHVQIKNGVCRIYPALASISNGPGGTITLFGMYDEM